MNLYLISQIVNDDYDAYGSAIVCADTEDEARMTHPEENDEYDPIKEWNGEKEKFSPWCAAKDVKVLIIGAAANNLRRGVILASFNGR
jgi:hypothetical protein